MQNPELSEFDVEQRLFQLVNEYRISVGMPLLEWNETISEVCRSHSSDMASGLVPVGHDGFNSRIDILRQSIPLLFAGENIGFITGYTNPAVAIFNEWMISSGHLKNIEGQFSLSGIGVARNINGAYYITQIFVACDSGF